MPRVNPNRVSWWGITAPKEAKAPPASPLNRAKKAMTKLVIELNPTPSSSGMTEANNRRIRILTTAKKKLVIKPKIKKIYTSWVAEMKTHTINDKTKPIPFATMRGLEPKRSLKNLQKLPARTTAKEAPTVYKKIILEGIDTSREKKAMVIHITTVTLM